MRDVPQSPPISPHGYDARPDRAGGISASQSMSTGASLLGDGPTETPRGDRNVRLAAPVDLQLTLFAKAG